MTEKKELDPKVFYAIGLILGRFVNYKLYRRFGAPKWAALAISHVIAQDVYKNLKADGKL